MALDLYTLQLGPLDRLKNGLALRARRRIFDIFMRECRPRPDERIADFGVTGSRGHPVHTFFEDLYPYKERLTAIGRKAEQAGWYAEAFPGLTFLEADLRSIPVFDGHFDAGICNAVLEHAGTREQQADLAREVCRVCRRVLFTTPNKRFPLEVHTMLPLVHWLPDPAFRAITRRLGYGERASVAHLNPLDAEALLAVLPPERDNRLIVPPAPTRFTNLLCVSFAR